MATNEDGTYNNMTKITSADLRNINACVQQIELFERMFPDGVVPTVELCKEHASLFDWDFAARNLLSTPAWAQYDATRAPALAQYEAARAQAWAEQWIADNQG